MRYLHYTRIKKAITHLKKTLNKHQVGKACRNIFI
ncbi:DUF3983 domain-containing protein [Bacillus toyonensis]|nr:DUF3983 domain-containing protein [Bacillus toyonensis]KAB2385908.1 DUF3983 domain-containing protein [Bacillus toyonensis]